MFFFFSICYPCQRLCNFPWSCTRNYALPVFHCVLPFLCSSLADICIRYRPYSISTFNSKDFLLPAAVAGQKLVRVVVIVKIALAPKQFEIEGRPSSSKKITVLYHWGFLWGLQRTLIEAAGRRVIYAG